MALREIKCPHVVAGVQVTCSFEVALSVNNAGMLLQALVCGNCEDSYNMGAKVRVTVADPMVELSGIETFSIYRAAVQTGGRPKVEPQKEPDSITRIVTIGAYSVVLYAEPRLRTRELARWSARFISETIPVATYRRIVRAVEAGIEAKPPQPVGLHAQPNGDPELNARVARMNRASKILELEATLARTRKVLNAPGVNMRTVQAREAKKAFYAAADELRKIAPRSRWLLVDPQSALAGSQPIR